MSNWKYTTRDNNIVSRTNEDGSIESCLITELPLDVIPDPADPIPEIDPKVALQSQIEEIEKATMVPRVVREMMLTWAQVEATRQVEKLAAEGTVTTVEELLSANVAYQKVKAVEDQIEAIRDQIRKLP